MTAKRKKEEEIQDQEPIELSNESTAQEQAMDAPVHPADVLAAKKSLEEVIEDSPESTDEDEHLTATAVEGDLINTSAHEEKGQPGSSDFTMDGVVVERDPIYQTKTSNPFTVVEMRGTPQPPPLEVADEWQPESAPVNRGASQVDMDKVNAKEAYLYPAYDPSIPVCSKCGEKMHTGTYGHPICPINDAGCPVLEAAATKASENAEQIKQIQERREQLRREAEDLDNKERGLRNAK